MAFLAYLPITLFECLVGQRFFDHRLLIPQPMQEETEHVGGSTSGDAPYAGWSALPGRIPPVEPPRMTGPTCPLLPVSCGSCTTGRCVVPAQQPVVPVPVYQEIRRKDRIVEVPQTVVTDKIIPKLYHQQIVYEVPKLSIQFREKIVRIPRVEFRQKIIEVPVPVAYVYKPVKRWSTRQVPKVIPKYVGPQTEVYVEVPQVKIVDKTVEREVPVYVGEKIVRKEVLNDDSLVQLVIIFLPWLVFCAELAIHFCFRS